MALTVHLEADEYSSNDLSRSIGTILAGSRLMAMATVSSDGSAHVNTAFFAESDDFRLFFVSEQSARHCQFLRSNPSVATSVWLNPPEYGEHLQGIQMFGAGTKLSGDEAGAALDRYREKFPAFRDDSEMRDILMRADGNVAIYQLAMDRVTLLDEPSFGRRKYIEVTVAR